MDREGSVPGGAVENDPTEERDCSVLMSGGRSEEGIDVERRYAVTDEDGTDARCCSSSCTVGE